MNFKLLITAATAASAMALSGCEVEQTQQAELPDVDVRADAGQLPKYDVDIRKTQDGRMPDVDVDVSGGQLPKYDIDGPDIDIGTKKATVKFPDVDVDVDMVEKTITVPDVDVRMADDEDDAEDEDENS